MTFKEFNKSGHFSSHCPEEEFRKSIAVLFARFDQIEEALTEYLLLIKLNPQVGLVFDSRSNTERANQYYRKAVELDDHHPEAHFKLGNNLYRQKRPGEAKKEMERALLFDPHNNKAYYIIGKVLKDGKNYLAALQAFEKAQQDPAYKTMSLVERGECYISTGSMDLALLELERAIALSKQDSSPATLHIRYWLAHCYDSTRTLEKALDQWEKIHSVNPSYRDVAEKLSHYREARTDDTMKDYLSCAKKVFRQLTARVVENMGLSIQDELDIYTGQSNDCPLSDFKGLSYKDISNLAADKP